MAGPEKEACAVCHENAAKRDEIPDCDSCLPHVEPERENIFNLVLFLLGAPVFDVGACLQLCKIFGVAAIPRNLWAIKHAWMAGKRVKENAV